MSPLERCDSCRAPVPDGHFVATGNLRGESWYQCLRCARIQTASRDWILGDDGMRRKPRPSAEDEWFNRPLAWDEDGNFLG